jgi:NDP-sugar pyrophosphorylase family protein
MKCLILASGQGTRLAKYSDSKPLTPLLGVPLIERVILTAHTAGISDFTVVTGYRGEKVRLFWTGLQKEEISRSRTSSTMSGKRRAGLQSLKLSPISTRTSFF